MSYAQPTNRKFPDSNEAITPTKDHERKKQSPQRNRIGSEELLRARTLNQISEGENLKRWSPGKGGKQCEISEERRGGAVNLRHAPKNHRSGWQTGKEKPTYGTENKEKIREDSAPKERLKPCYMGGVWDEKPRRSEGPITRTG